MKGHTKEHGIILRGFTQSELRPIASWALSGLFSSA